MSSTDLANGQPTRFLLGHQILRHSGRGCRWFTVDEDRRRFDSAQAAVRFIRSLDPLESAAFAA